MLGMFLQQGGLVCFAACTERPVLLRERQGGITVTEDTRLKPKNIMTCRWVIQVNPPGVGKSKLHNTDSR